MGLSKKEWLDRKSKKKKRKRRKKKCHTNMIAQKGQRRWGKSKNKSKYIPRKEEIVIDKEVPVIFSFLEKAEDTVRFFGEFAKELENTKNKIFRIQSEKVEKVTVDALIYLLIMMKNYGVLKQHVFVGDLPRNEEAKRIYIESGFLENVTTNNVGVISKNPEKLKIILGKDTDSEITTKLIEFVSRKQKREIKELLSLQKMFIEMMLNVVNHAYSANSRVKQKNWCIYAEHIEDFVRIVFIDTGVGIAKTVKKNMPEKILHLATGLNVGKITDSYLVKSALNGDFRTRTNEPHRGNGLGKIKEWAVEELFLNFSVISGRGRCEVARDGMIAYDYKHNVSGTIFLFDVK